MKRSCIFFSATFFCTTVFAQFDGARTYWALPKNLNILSAHAITAKGNASINNINYITPEITVNNNLYMLTYTRSQPIFDRTFFSTLIIPAGGLSANIGINGPGGTNTKTIFSHGLGDLIWTNTINVLGAKGLMIKDFVRHENSTLVYFQESLTIPTGQYNAEDSVSMGSNQFKLKLGLPIVQRIGPKVEGSRMTIEVFPSYSFVSKNKDYLGLEIEQGGMFVLETHITRDITTNAFISLDYSYLNSGGVDFVSKQNGAITKKQAGQNVHLLGATVGYIINDRMNIFLSHSQTLNSKSSKNVSLDGLVTKITFSWSFHDFQEKFKKYLDSN